VEALKGFEANVRWAVSHEAELDRYAGRYIAVDGEELLSVDDSAQALPDPSLGK
jgi:hypothetical protein